MDQGERLADRRKKERRQKWIQHISGVLFIRFPGVDPEPMMRWLYPITRPFLSLIGMVLAGILCLSALVVFAANYQQYVSEFPQMHQWLRMESLLILAGVIGVTKVLHELGHALICKRFGGECHQIGPMLLVFTPALYCDTSDSWMLPSRWQRAAVGVAGIATEVLLAAIATFVWVNSAPGLVHTIAMNVMLVCSISTVLFNANPLLRYDGYYVLSDLCDTPNLGEKSRRALSALAAWWFAGIDESTSEDDEQGFWLIVYAILSTLYRWGLTLLILWFVSIMLRPYGLGSVGRVLCVVAIGGLLFTLFRNPFRFMRNPARRRLIKMNRVMISAGVIGVLIGLMCYPFPSGVSASGRLLPRSETPVYISTAGQLNAVMAVEGQNVVKGDTLATLHNPDTEIQYLRAKGRFEKQKQLTESIIRSQVTNPDATNELPAAQALLAELENQMQTRKQQLDALEIKAPASGRLLAVSRRRPEANSGAGIRLVGWSGFPTDPENRSCFLESGTELLSIATSDQWDTELVLSQSQVQRIQAGNEVRLLAEAMPSRVIVGTVTEISEVNWSRDQHSMRQDDPEAAQAQQPAETSYVVRVQLPTTDAPLKNGAAVSAVVDAEPISVFGRINRGLNGLLRFR